MKPLLIAARVLLSLSGILLLLLGLCFWFGYAYNLLPLHMALGGVLVLSMWVIAGLALFAKLPPAFPALVLVWSLIVPALGMTQMAILPGPWHWTIRLLHLLVGGAAIGLGQRLAGRIVAKRSAAA